MKKLFCLMVIMAVLVGGCAVLQKTCQYQDKYFEYKGKVAAALATIQVGYPMVVAAVNAVKPNVLDVDKVGAGLQDVSQRAVVVDMALDYLGKLYFDAVCLTPEDVEKAEAFADVALAQKAALENMK